MADPPGEAVTAMVHVEVRPETCMASGYCIRSAPRVFGSDADGWVTLLDADPNGQTEQVLQAARMCPVAAIDVFDGDGGQLS